MKLLQQKKVYKFFCHLSLDFTHANNNRYKLELLKSRSVHKKIVRTVNVSIMIYCNIYFLILDNNIAVYCIILMVFHDAS